MNEQNNNVQNTNQTVNNNVQVVKSTNGFAVAGFVISLVSTILCCGTFNWLSLVFSIIGLVNSKNMNNEGKSLAIAGIVISSIFLILTIILYALGITASVLEGIQN